MSKRSRKKKTEPTGNAQPTGEATEFPSTEFTSGATAETFTRAGEDAAYDGDAAGELDSAPHAAGAAGPTAGATDEPDGLAEAVEELEDALDAPPADDDFDEDDGEEDVEFVIHDADAEDAAEKLARLRESLAASGEHGEVAPGGTARDMAELMAICEALVFVSEEPLTAKTIAEVLAEERGWVQVAIESLAREFNERNGGMMLREVAGGWQFATRPEHHEHVRAFLKTRPSAKLSLAALETLAVIAYKQPITVPEILEIRGVQSSSAIKTLLDKRLIVAKGRKETVGRPMMYGTSKDFLLQFGLKDLSELPSMEDFEDLAGGDT